MNKHLLNLWKDFRKNGAIRAGENFEEDTADFFFPDNIYEMIHRTHDVNTNSKRFIRSSMFPDFQFGIRNTNIEFWVECKLRFNNADASKINVFKSGQLERYKQFTNSFLFLCAHYEDEEYFFFVPMYEIKWDSLFMSFLRPYEITIEPPILPGLIKKYYFNK